MVKVGQIWVNNFSGMSRTITEITGDKIWFENGEFVQTNSLLKYFTYVSN